MEQDKKKPIFLSNKANIYTYHSIFSVLSGYFLKSLFLLVHLSTYNKKHNIINGLLSLRDGTRGGTRWNHL